MTTTTYTTTIDAYLREDVEARVARANRRAARNGLAGYTLTIIDAEPEPVWPKESRPEHRGDEVVHVSTVFPDVIVAPEYYRERIEVTIDGITPALPGGWALIGMVIEDEICGPMPRLIDDSDRARAVDLSAYRDADSWNDCDHCHRTRDRATVYLLMDEAGHVARVGSTCLSAFLGIQISIPTGYVTKLRDDLDELGGMGFGGSPAYRIRDIIAVALAQADTRGWVSRAKANDAAMYGERDCTATVDVVKAIMGWKKPAQVMKRHEMIDSVSQDRVTAVIDHVAALDETRERDPEFVRTLHQVYAHPVASGRNVGVVAAAVPGWLREQERRRTADLSSSRHVGEVNKRQAFAGLTVVGVKALPGYQDRVKHLVKMVDPAGNLLVWFATAAAPELDARIDLVGRVKEHSEFNGVAQTVLTNCKFTTAQ